MSTQRNYSASDVGMLTAILTITESAIAAEEFLSAKRPVWEAPYFQDLRTRILSAFSTILGINNVSELSRYTKTVTGLQKELLSDIADFRVQLKADFADNPARAEELLTLLGFKNAGVTLKEYKNNQESLAQLLQRIKTNITPELKTELQEKGMAPQTIDNILANADTYIEANIQQENFKSHKKTLTDANKQELNNLYATVMGIGKIARSFYKGQPTEQAKFTFKNVLRNQGYRPQKTEQTDPTETPSE
ncbi:MAG: hypothetical protein Q4G48_07885 [Bacteroidia bacterium]|nr:hypothetical protein [Bacteroidia bacterium]